MHANTSRRRLRDRLEKRSGTILVLAAALMVVVMAALAFSIDLGYMYNAQAELDRAVDAAALAGAGSLVDGEAAANDAIVEYLVRNPLGVGGQYAVDEDQLALAKTRFLEQYGDELEIEIGHWNLENRSFSEGGVLPSTISLSMTYPQRPLFFAKFFGRDNFAVQSQAVAMFRPRDIMVVLDFSASMNDDSELTAIGSLGQEAVEANIYQMWEDLEFETYGNMGFDPDWVTVPGETLPFTVKWRSNAVDISAEVNMDQVSLRYADGNWQTFNTSSSSGTWQGTGGQSGDRITRCAVNIDGNWETIDFYDNADIIRGLGLTNVDYPYDSGDWGDFVEYCRSHSSSMPWYDSAVYDAGYRRQFGMLLLINFWNKNKPRNNQTEDLWKVGAQPIQAVKDAVDIFMDFVRNVDADDRVGLAVYNAADGDAILEHELTNDLDALVEIVDHRQAGHYHNYTNIGAGMQEAREHLQESGRENAKKMIVLMTDGQANWVNGSYSTSGAREYVLAEAALAEGLEYPIVTISLGVDADAALMEDVATITDGKHFNVPGGEGVAAYTEDLIQVFRDIADARPLKLVE